MKLDTYESLVVSGRYLTVPAGHDPLALPLPDERALQQITLVRGGYALAADGNATSPLVTYVLNQIEAAGYAIHSFGLALFEARSDDAA